MEEFLEHLKDYISEKDAVSQLGICASTLGHLYQTSAIPVFVHPKTKKKWYHRRSLESYKLFREVQKSLS